MKKLFALLLAITMMATLSVTAFAAEYDTEGDKGMNVTYSVNPGYTVTIPPTVTIGENGTTAEVSAADVVVEKGKYVSVTLAADNNFTVTSGEGATLTYTVTKGEETVAAGGEILAVNPADGKTGSASPSILTRALSNTQAPTPAPLPSPLLLRMCRPSALSSTRMVRIIGVETGRIMWFIPSLRAQLGASGLPRRTMSITLRMVRIASTLPALLSLSMQTRKQKSRFGLWLMTRSWPMAFIRWLVIDCER